MMLNAGYVRLFMTAMDGGCCAINYVFCISELSQSQQAGLVIAPISADSNGKTSDVHLANQAPNLKTTVTLNNSQ